MENLPTSKAQPLAELMKWQAQPLETYKTIECNSVNDLMMAKTPSFALIRSLSEKKPIAELIIKLFFLDFMKFVGQETPEQMVDQIASMILKEYSFYKPEHLRLCFDRIKAGKYGKSFGAINGMFIMDCLKQFDSEICEEIANKRQHESHNHKFATTSLFDIVKPSENASPEIKEETKKFRETLASIGRESTPENEKDRRQIMNETEQQILRDFDELYKKGGLKEYEPIRAINYNGEPMDSTMYLKTRLQEFTNT